MQRILQPLIMVLLMNTTVVMATSSTNVKCHINDFKALKSFYESTNGDQWKNNTGWELIKNNDTMPQECDLSKLYGITTFGGRVIRFGFFNNNIQNGQIPRSIYLLEKLITLQMSNQNLSGIIPVTFGYMQNLKSITLTNNKLEGPIPLSIGFVENLDHLVLSFNNLTGEIPVQIANCTALRRLEINNNQITGEIPPQIGRLQNLNTFNASNNQLSGRIPAELGSCKNLRFCRLNDNMLTGSLPAYMGELAILNVRNNKLGRCYPAELHYLCEILPNSFNKNYFISDGNLFESTWENFDENYAGICKANLKINEDNDALNLQITPNISGGTFNLNVKKAASQQPIHLTIYNSAGLQVHKQTVFQTLGNNHTINIQNCSKGNYIVHMKQNNQMTSQKIILY